jgi:hypothetical protein
MRMNESRCHDFSCYLDDTPVAAPNTPLIESLDGAIEMEARYADTHQAVSDYVNNPRQLHLQKGLAWDFAFRLGSERELFQQSCPSNGPVRFQ